MFEIIDLTNKKWISLTKYLRINRLWKFVYNNYVLFILNERVKLKDMVVKMETELKELKGSSQEIKVYEC